MSAAATPDLPQLATAEQTAGALGVTKWAVYRWHERGLLPGVRLGRRVLFEPAAVAAFVAARRTGGQVADELAAARAGR